MNAKKVLWGLFGGFYGGLAGGVVGFVVAFVFSLMITHFIHHNHDGRTIDNLIMTVDPIAAFIGIIAGAVLGAKTAIRKSKNPRRIV